MEWNKPLSEICPGDSIEGFYIIKSAAPKLTVSGKPFLVLALQDKTGTADAKVWDYSGPIGQADEGKILKIRGSVSEYRGAIQVTVERLRLANDNDPVDRSALAPSAPIDPSRMTEEIQTTLESIEDEDYRRIALSLLNRHRERFARIPAAKSVHHGFLSGLLMHTGNMLRLADFLSALYAGTVDRSLLLAGTFAHDIQKETEFVFSELGLAVDYSVKGQLLGHLVMGAQEIAALSQELNIPEEKSVLLQHMVLSHHGEPQFGAAIVPQCAESELLSEIDLIDSRMEIYRETYADMEPGSFSGRIFALDKKIYRHF